MDPCILWWHHLGDLFPGPALRVRVAPALKGFGVRAPSLTMLSASCSQGCDVPTPLAWLEVATKTPWDSKLVGSKGLTGPGECLPCPTPCLARPKSSLFHVHMSALTSLAIGDWALKEEPTPGAHSSLPLRNSLGPQYLKRTSHPSTQASSCMEEGPGLDSQRRKMVTEWRAP